MRKIKVDGKCSHYNRSIGGNSIKVIKYCSTCANVKNFFQIPIVIVLAFANASYPYQGVTIGLTPYSHPVLSQYHAQDVHGQYSYGYATPTATMSESKTADGVTHGGYSYIDSNGHLQTVQYVADATHGFRVAASNLPVDLPEVAYAKAKHAADYEATKAEHAVIAAERQLEHAAIAAQHASIANEVRLRTVVASPVVLPHVASPAVLAPVASPVIVPVDTPVPVQELPEVIKARADHFAAIEATRIRDAHIAAEHAQIAAQRAAYISPVPEYVSKVVPVASQVSWAKSNVVYTPAIFTPASQYQQLNGLGEYSYGYTGPLSSKSESRSADGVTRGGYSYIDANGILQTVHYVSDPVNGFRVAATNLPVDHRVYSNKIIY